MTTHWHVGQNIPGYLPESDVDYCATKAEAIRDLKERKNQWVEAGWQLSDLPDLNGQNQYAIEGNAQTDLGYWITDRLGGWHHLGYVIWAIECNDEDCEDEDY